MADGTCSVDGCDRRPYAKGICDVHRWRMRTYGSFDLPERFCTGCGTSLERTTARAQPRVCAACRVVARSPESARSRRLRNGDVIRAQNRARYAARRQPKRCADCPELLEDNTRQRCGVCAERHAIAARAERNARWARENRELKQHLTRRRQAVKRGVPSEPFTFAYIADRDGWRCALCGLPVDRRLRHPDRMSGSIDHIIPLSRGGHDTKANTQLAHLSCNSAKRNRVLPHGEQLRLIG